MVQRDGVPVSPFLEQVTREDIFLDVRDNLRLRQGPLTGRALPYFSKVITPVLDLSQFLDALLRNKNGDALDTDTLGLQGVVPYIFNGSTFDRVRANELLNLIASAARTANGNTGALTNRTHSTVLILLDVTAVSGTSPTLDPRYIVYLDSTNASTTGIAWRQITAAGDYLMALGSGASGVFGSATLFGNVDGAGIPLARIYHIEWAIGGTSPSFTFSVEAQFGR